jgi:[ribosomal protein S18]-alanine N-acetyltransferase
MAIVVRRAIEADWARIIALHRRAAVHERRLTGMSADADIADAQHHFRGELCVAVSSPGHRLLGFVSWTGHELMWLYVEPASFRRGIGSLLMRHALDQMGFVVQIRVLAGNVPMLGLCAAQGFVSIDDDGDDGGRAGIPSVRLRRVAGLVAKPIVEPRGVPLRQPGPRIGGVASD